MKYVSKKVLLYANLMQLAVATTALTSGCSYNENTKGITNDYFEYLIEQENHMEIQKLKMQTTLASMEASSQPISKTIEETKLFKEIPSVIATTNVNIRKAPIDGNLVGKLVEGQTLEMVEELSNGWYKVLYYGEECYVSGDYVSKTITYQVNGDIKKVCYATADIEITIPKEVSKSGGEESAIIPRLECLEIYEENEDNYLVQTADYIGYVAKTSLEELTGTFVVVDISNQELKLYENNEVILETPVITGKPSTPTYEGLFSIYNITHNRYLKGAGYESYVDVMMKFNKNEGLHDAEYHYCDNGIEPNHGWRNSWDFGGNTYLTNGSHGCVNMPHDAVMKVYDYVDEGTPVLIKK